MSIGALSRVTGVPADTLRTWERRYGFPAAERTESGHRRYSLRTLERLKLVLRLLELGHRPSSVVTQDEGTLREWVALGKGALPEQEALAPSPAPGSERDRIAQWLEHVVRYEGRALVRELRVAYAAHGGIAFLDRLLGPFLCEVGARWHTGGIGVRHEHFASERVQEFLVQTWRPLSDAASGAIYVCAAPPDEAHVLALHMAALVLAWSNARVVMLGANAPIADIAQTAADHAAEAVVLSAARGADRTQLAAGVLELRAALPASVAIVAGGSGFAPALPGIVTLASFADLAAFVAPNPG